MGPQFTLLLSINVLYTNVKITYLVSCLVEINLYDNMELFNGQSITIVYFGDIS